MDRRVTSTGRYWTLALPSVRPGPGVRRTTRTMSISILLLASAASAQLVPITSVSAFESEIISSTKCWAVLFVSRDRDVAAAIKLTERLSQTMPGLSLASADVDDVKSISSEFNVRKRMVPRLLIFTSRARQASVVKLKAEGSSEISLEEVMPLIQAALSDNGKAESGDYEKLTLSIGGGKDEV